MKKRIENLTFDSTLSKFGKGLFETIKVHKGKAMLIDEHLDRIFNSLNELDFPFDITKKKIKEDIVSQCEALNDKKDKALRLTVCDEGYNLSFRDITYGPKDYERGFNLCVSPVKRGFSPLYSHKTSNYLENIYSLQKAKKRGFDEALFLNFEDMVLEGTISNIFFVGEDKIFTPPLSLGILPGIMRQKVIDSSKDLGIEVKYKEIKYSEICNYNFSFITNSLMELMKVNMIQDFRFEDENEVFAALNRKIKELLYEG
ncbi:aminotransferase class IV [Natranaerofaba carboxydovora]|uniref:aminotransferase class IV n=1 Tax=Natranaerofaba carboxydovora TaxID=2742683 RepID=UPI001F12D1A2|nr:aminotransferase class IV [Natranaerofaba carboxydovora]UMZ74921.1 Aminodeoxychorismate lyase [Natranaerofaba carboxydovora]